jgi:hypothetical protein
MRARVRVASVPPEPRVLRPRFDVGDRCRGLARRALAEEPRERHGQLHVPGLRVRRGSSRLLLPKQTLTNGLGVANPLLHFSG